MDLHAGERLFEQAQRLVAANPEIARVVGESAAQHADLDAGEADQSTVAGQIAEDVVHYLLAVGWSPPGGQLAVLYRDLLTSIWLYVDWRYVTRQLTTTQRELWADAIDAEGAVRHPDDPTQADRWWRPSAPQSNPPNTDRS